MYNDFEQDLILACKCHYGEDGIKKVIADYVGYIDTQDINIDSIYHFISELYIKMVENKHLNFSVLLEYRLSPKHIYDHKYMGDVFNKAIYSLYDFPRIICDHMIAEIQGVKVYNTENSIEIIKLHEPQDKFKDKED